MSAALVLFTRDLRVHDQPALTAAVRRHDAVIPLFVLDRRLLAGSCGAPNRLAFLEDCLRDLHAALQARGAGLVVRHGEPVREALALASAHGASDIYISADCTPYARERERRLADACRRSRVALHALPGITALPPGAVTPHGGDHYRVFTPYWRVWSQVTFGDPLPAPRRVVLPGTLPAPDTSGPHVRARGRPSPSLPPGGEREARRRLSAWLRGGLDRYDALHDDLAAAATSRLSPHLHFGCISARTLLTRAGTDGVAQPLRRQLCWRDFHHQVLAARPDMPRVDYRPRGRRWQADGEAAAAWRAGLTGLPIVDAGMRQLAREGFMHNRARLIVASFLTKTLGVDWRLGAAHFATLLVDADVANNVGNWQWVAGTGNDTRPNRVLNPLRQAARFDPRGDYVRRYVPELEAIPGAAVQRPWLLPTSVRRALRYPDPVLDAGPAGRR